MRFLENAPEKLLGASSANVFRWIYDRVQKGLQAVIKEIKPGYIPHSEKEWS